MLDKNTMKAKRLNGELWYEIDDIQDLDIAQTLFIEDDVERYHHLMQRYGGYWRFPHLQDYCYLVNPYFPTKRMQESTAASVREPALRTIIMQAYPNCPSTRVRMPH